MYLSGNSPLSSLVLNLNTVSLHTMSSLKVFHLLIQRTGKLFNICVFSFQASLKKIFLWNVSIHSVMFVSCSGLTAKKKIVIEPGTYYSISFIPEASRQIRIGQI